MNSTPPTNSQTPRTAPAKGGAASTQFKKVLPGLSAERLAELSCSLGQSTQEDAASLVNRAIEVWNQSQLAMCRSEEDRRQLLQVLNPVLIGQEFVSFEELAETGEVPSRRNREPIRSAKGVEKAVIHYLEILRKARDLGNSHDSTGGGMTPWKSKLDELEHKCRTEKLYPACAVENLRQFQIVLRFGKPHRPTIHEVAAVLALTHELPRWIQVDDKPQPAKQVRKTVKKKF